MPKSTALDGDEAPQIEIPRIPPAPEPRQDNLAPTPAESWNGPRVQGFLVELPSGNICRVKRLMDMKELAIAGKIPNPLGQTVMRMISEGEPALDLQQITPAEQVQAILFMDSQVCRMMIEPRCMIPPEKDDEGNDVIAELWKPPAGCISILDLTQEDRLFLFNVSNGGVTDLATFRRVQNGLVEVASSRPRVPRPTKRTGGTQRARSRSKRS